MTHDAPKNDPNNSTEIVRFGVARTDPYSHLREERWREMLENPKVLSPHIRTHLVKENTSFKEHAVQFADLKKEIAKELKGRIIQKSSTVPERDGNWEYWSEFKEEENYPTYLRKNISNGHQDVLFNGQEESKDSEFFDLASITHSPDHKTIAYAVDREGSEYFDLAFRDIETGEDLPEVLKRTKGDAVWTPDSWFVYYVECDDKHIGKRVKLHHIGTDPQEDILIYEEADKNFEVSLKRSQSGDYLFIQSQEGDTSEVRFIKNQYPPSLDPTLMCPRKKDHEYHVDQRGNYFYIRTNTDNAVNFKMMRTMIKSPDRSHWKDVLPYNPMISITDFVCLKEYLVTQELYASLPCLGVSDYLDDKYLVKFANDDSAFDITLYPGNTFDTDELRINYETLANPGKVYDINLATQHETLHQQRTLPDNHNPDDYIIERKFVPSRDKNKIPVTILRHKSTKEDGSAPLYLTGYGSYGSNMPLYFADDAISLVNHGAIYAIAHTRGGNEMGREWYLEGRRHHKHNTFNDFIDTAEELIKTGYGQKGQIIIEGMSAGGLLMGVAVNTRPDLFGGVIAIVPYVDVMNSMCDPSIPWVEQEFCEWGDPAEEEMYKYMLQYSPYDNIDRTKDYPPILAIAGLTDSRVMYWEPAKWIARLKDEAKGGPFYLKTHMKSGHAGSSARFENVDEMAERIAFALHRFKELGHDISLRPGYTPPSSGTPSSQPI